MGRVWKAVSVALEQSAIRLLRLAVKTRLRQYEAGDVEGWHEANHIGAAVAAGATDHCEVRYCPYLHRGYDRLLVEGPNKVPFARPTPPESGGDDDGS